MSKVKTRLDYKRFFVTKVILSYVLLFLILISKSISVIFTRFISCAQIADYAAFAFRTNRLSRAHVSLIPIAAMTSNGIEFSKPCFNLVEDTVSHLWEARRPHECSSDRYVAETRFPPQLTEGVFTLQHKITGNLHRPRDTRRDLKKQLQS